MQIYGGYTRGIQGHLFRVSATPNAAGRLHVTGVRDTAAQDTAATVTHALEPLGMCSVGADVRLPSVGSKRCARRCSAASNSTWTTSFRPEGERGTGPVPQGRGSAGTRGRDRSARLDLNGDPAGPIPYPQYHAGRMRRTLLDVLLEPPRSPSSAGPASPTFPNRFADVGASLVTTTGHARRRRPFTSTSGSSSRSS